MDDHSEEITCLKRELFKFMEENKVMDSYQPASTIVQFSMTKENEAELKNLVESKQYSKAIKLASLLKDNFSGKSMIFFGTVEQSFLNVVPLQICLVTILAKRCWCCTAERCSRTRRTCSL